jgi:signal transduction histidine kinase
VPLWSERGLIGVLLLGDKTDGGLYVQEEIEIARAGGERLIDALASAELAHRLLALQRQRLAESQVLDRRARRVLHDDVLPQVHAALLHLDGRAAPAPEAMRLLGAVHHDISDLLRDLPASPSPQVALLGLLPALRQLVEDEFAHTFDDVQWQVEPAAEQSAASLAPLAAEVFFYAAREAMRNAARYGRQPGSPAPLHLRLTLSCAGGGLTLVVEDNGPGLPIETAVPDPAAGGAGQGLALHRTLLAVLGGTLAVASQPDAFTRVTLSLPPASLAGLRVR